MKPNSSGEKNLMNDILSSTDVETYSDPTSEDQVIETVGRNHDSPPFPSVPKSRDDAYENIEVVSAINDSRIFIPDLPKIQHIFGKKVTEESLKLKEIEEFISKNSQQSNQEHDSSRKFLALYKNIFSYEYSLNIESSENKILKSFLEEVLLFLTKNEDSSFIASILEILHDSVFYLNINEKFIRESFDIILDRALKEPKLSEKLIDFFDLDREDNFAASAMFLEILSNYRNHVISIRSADYAGQVNKFVDSLVRKVLSQGTKGYLLRRYTKRLFHIDSDSIEYQRGAFGVGNERWQVFEISPGILAYSPSNDEIYILRDKNEQEEVMLLLENMNEMVNEAYDFSEFEYKYAQYYASDLSRMRKIFMKEVVSRGQLEVPGINSPQDMQFFYACVMSPDMLDEVKEDLGIDITQLRLREQFQFLYYLKGVSQDEAERLRSLIGKYGAGSLRIFLVAPQTNGLCNAIYDFSENHDEVLVREVFKTFGRLVERIDDADEYLRQNFGTSSATHANAVVEQLLTRARKLLEDAVKVNSQDMDAFLEKVRAVDGDIALFTSACRTLKKTGALQLEGIEGVSISEKPAHALGEDEKSKLLALQDQAYRSLYAPEFLASLREALTAALENPNTHFYFLRKAADGEEEIVSTLRFDERNRETNTKHLASFFTDPSYNGGAIGEALLDEALMREQADGSAIVLECSPHLAGFYQKHGFIEMGHFDFKGESGVSMRKDPVMQPYTKLSDEETFAEHKTA